MTPVATGPLVDVDTGPRRSLPGGGAITALAGRTSGQSLLLVANTAISAVLGLLYWGVAARRLPLGTVGSGTAAISAVTTISGLAQLNLFASLSVLIPGAPAGGRAALVRRIYLITTGLSVVGTGAVLAVAPAMFGSAGAPSLAMALLATVFAALWTVFTLQDGALIAVRGAWWVLVTNVAFGVAKLVLLVALPAGPDSGVVLWSWYAPLIVLVPLTNVVVFVRLRRDRAEVHHPVPLRLARFVAVDYVSFLVIQLTTTALPVYVVTIAGPESAAVFATCWMVSTSLDLAITNVAVAMSATIARRPHEAGRVVRNLSVRLAGPLALVVAVLAVAAPWVLRVFGTEYARDGTTVLRLLLVGCLFRVVVTFCSAVMRSLRRPATVISIQLTAALVVLAAGLPAMHRWGVTALAVCWPASQLVAGGVAVLLARLALRAVPGTGSSPAP